MNFSVLLYILAGAGVLYLLVFFGLTRIKFFNRVPRNFFSYYRKPINEIPRAGAQKILKDFLLWRALKLIISLAVIIIVIGGFFAWQYLSAPKIQKEASLLNFEIIPSCKDKYSNTRYPAGALAVAEGENLSKVEFWAVPSGTGLEDTLYTENEIIKKDDQWESSLTASGMWVIDFYAIGYDMGGEQIGKISLGPIEEGGYPESCEKDNLIRRRR